jgi:hypothetical protein
MHATAVPSARAGSLANSLRMTSLTEAAAFDNAAANARCWCAAGD